jgi:hypothetical protein
MLSQKFIWLARPCHGSAGPSVICHDSPVIERDPAACMFGDIQGVRHHKDGTAIPVQMPKQRQDLIAGLAIKRSGRLVRQDESWMIYNSTSDDDALLLATRKLMGPVVPAMS